MKFIINLFIVFYLVLKPIVPVMDYVVNYEYISKVICINKDKPELLCKGKCYLQKELAKSSKEDVEKTKNNIQKIIDFYMSNENLEIQNYHIEHFATQDFIYQMMYSFLFLEHLFKPPII